jgi:hypothetical protein
MNLYKVYVQIWCNFISICYILKFYFILSNFFEVVQYELQVHEIIE